MFALGKTVITGYGMLCFTYYTSEWSGQFNLFVVAHILRLIINGSHADASILLLPYRI